MRRSNKLMVRVALLALVASTVVLARRDYGVATIRTVPTRAAEVSVPVDRARVVALPFAAGHVAVHWPGHRDLAVTLELSVDGELFGPALPVQLDEVAEGHPSGETFGAIMAAHGATHVRLVADRPLGRVTVLTLADGQPQTTTRVAPTDEAGGADVLPPFAITSRSKWEAEEQYRYQRRRGVDVEIWPQDFHRVQKLVLHHTAGGTPGDTAAAMAEVRAIYYYHAVTQGWGDIGYNFLVDQSGNVYEGRYSGGPIGEDKFGRVVTAGHTYQHNVGTVGIAWLGDAMNVAPSPAALGRIRQLLAWEADRHQLDLRATSTYRNVINDVVREAPNLAGHRDYVATACPGTHYPTIATVLAGVPDTPGDAVAPDAGPAPTVVGGRRQITVSWDASTETWPLGSGIAYYEVQRGPTLDGPFAAAEHTDDETLTFTDTGVRGAQAYRVIAVDGAGNRSKPSAATLGRAT